MTEFPWASTTSGATVSIDHGNLSVWCADASIEDATVLDEAEAEELAAALLDGAAILRAAREANTNPKETP